MLVLSRKQGEVIMAGNVAITIVRIYGEKVRVGVTAPPEVAVDRLEVWKAKQQSNNNRSRASYGKITQSQNAGGE